MRTQEMEATARALPAPALKAWAGKPENVPAAQQTLLHRTRYYGAARSGKYSAEMKARTT